MGVFMRANQLQDRLSFATKTASSDFASDLKDIILLSFVKFSVVLSFCSSLPPASPRPPSPATFHTLSGLLGLLNFNFSVPLPHCHYITLSNEIMEQKI